METKNLPEKKFSAGAISSTVWQNQGKGSNGEPVEYRTITFQRRYKDKSGVWQSTSTLRINDLPKASVVLQKTYEYIILSGINGSSEEYAVEGSI
ncbi:hypothetical protein HYX09_02535 [Candidatus Woesearchaeota archaeon]|nr:hypothetical protein [Candidatus Woesearchaeota archaeon]